jgi:hypothetical protein
MTSPLEYNQQLLAYLQVWRQLLEQGANLTAGLPSPTSSCAPPGFPAMPGMPPGMPFMLPGATNPPMPQTLPFTPPTPNSPTPPSPTDYGQQLFGYLQAWRQYLEQSPGTTPPPPPPAPPAPAQPAAPSSQPSGQPASTQPTQQSGLTAQQPSSGLEIPPKVLSAAINQLGNQQPFENSLDEDTVLKNPHLKGPFNEVGTRFDRAGSLFNRGSNAVATPQEAAMTNAASGSPAADGATGVTSASNSKLLQALNQGATAHANTDSLLGRTGINQASMSPSDAMVFLPGALGGTQITELPFTVDVARDAAPPAVAAPRPAAPPPAIRLPRTAFSGLQGRVNAPRPD